MGVLYMLQYSITSHSIHSFLVTNTLLKIPDKHKILHPCPIARLSHYDGCFIISKFETYHQNCIFDNIDYEVAVGLNNIDSLINKGLLEDDYLTAKKMFMDMTKYNNGKYTETDEFLEFDEKCYAVNQENEIINGQLLRLQKDDDDIRYDSVLYFYIVNKNDFKSETDKAINIMTDFVNQCTTYDDFINKTLEKMCDTVLESDLSPVDKLRELTVKMSIFDEKLVKSKCKDKFDDLQNNIQQTLVDNVSKILVNMANDDELKSLIPENIHPLDKDYKLDFKDAMFMFGVIQNKVQSYMQDDREIPKNLMEILKQLIPKKEYDAFEAYNAKI